jgi:DNA-binding SARP family transcriptional activator/tetratricopeptide (TPR) repeat protein
MDFRVLGPLQVVDGDRSVPLGGPRQRGVLALLLLEPNRVVSMDRLIDRLWGDHPPARATGTVQAYVSNLRRALEPGRRAGEPARVLVHRPPGYVLQVAPDDVDWLRFRRLVERARAVHATDDPEAADALLTEARALWRGPPLADVAEVAEPERVRLDELRLDAIEDHAEVRLALGRHAEVVADLEAAAAEHPLRERLRGMQMRALYRGGRQADALAVFDEVRRRLADELGTDPGADLRHLHEQLLRQDPGLDPPRPAPSPPSPPAAPGSVPSGTPVLLLGRAQELAVLRGHLGATQAGSGRAVLVEGEPGVGKTRLAEAVTDEAAARGFAVLWGRCAEGEGAPPLWPWAQILRAAGADRDPAALVPDRAWLDPRAARGQLNRALADLLRERSRARPLLVVLDDLQWADTATLALLEFLAADLTGARILVLATYRETDLPHAPRLADALGVLARLPGADRVTLRGLGVEEVAGLIRAHTGAEPEPGLAEAVHQRTEGNPFFVTELLRLGHPERLVERLLGGPVPVKVRDVIRRRVARLPRDARALLDTAALVGRDVDLRLVTRLSGLQGDRGLEAAEAALAVGLLAAVPEQVGIYRFAHALVRETLASDLAPLYRARLHERVALALLDTHGQDDEHAGQVAEHLWASLPAGDVGRALRAQARAAEVAWGGLAYEWAETLLERASELLRSLPVAEAPPDIDLAVHIRLGSLRSARYGYTPAVREAFDRARLLAERTDRRGDLLQALLGLSATAVVRGDLAAAGELTDAALEAAGDGPGQARASGRQGVGIVAFYRGRLAEARRQFAGALDAWRDAGDAPSQGVLRGPPASARPDVMARSYDALAACLMGDGAEAKERIEGALHAAEATGEPYAQAFVHSFHARLAVLERDHATAREAATRAIGIADEHGFPLLAGHAAIPLGWARAGDGEPQAGLAAIERGLATLHGSGQRILTPFHRSLQAEVLLALGDAAAALGFLDEALAESVGRGGGFEVPGLHHLRGRALDALGHREQALAAFRLAVAAAREQGASLPEQRALAALAALDEPS